jgi:endo-1,4-beta-xylanase
MRKSRAILFIFMFLLTACGPAFLQSSSPNPTQTVVPPITLTSTITPIPTRTPWPQGLPSLKALAGKHNLDIGAAVQSGLLKDEQPYRETVIREFSAITAENEMKMCVTMPERSRYDFAAADALVAFAQEHGMKIRGHTLVWVGCEPNWIKTGTFTKDEAKAILKEYITTVVTRYKGKVYAWDVLNETVYRGSAWQKLIGPEYEKLAFEWAHEADPDALLFYNDFDIEKPGGKFNAVYNFVKDLKDQGVPIHGVGMQMHFTITPFMEEVSETMQKIKDLGLVVHVTEFDLPIDHSSKTPLQDQAQGYREMLRVCLDAGNCTAFIIWGFTDKYSWLYTQLKDPEAEPMIFDRNYQPKPAYEALYQELGK